MNMNMNMNKNYIDADYQLLELTIHFGPHIIGP